MLAEMEREFSTLIEGIDYNIDLNLSSPPQSEDHSPIDSDNCSQESSPEVLISPEFMPLPI